MEQLGFFAFHRFCDSETNWFLFGMGQVSLKLKGTEFSFIDAIIFLLFLDSRINC